MAGTDTVDEKIKELILRGSALLDDERAALALYQQALGMIPEPVKAHRLAAQTYSCIGDSWRLLDQYEEARRAFQDALESKGGSGNAYVRLRLGQCAWDLGDLGQAEEHLARAWELKGEEIFEGEDARYLRFVKTLDRTRGES